MSSLVVERVGPDGRDAWTEFVLASPDREMGHAWELHDLVARVFRAEVVRLVARRGGEYAAVLPLVLQRSFLGAFLTSIPYFSYAGVLGCDPEARTRIAESASALARDLRADRLELRGRAGGDLPIPAFRAKSGFLLELATERETLWNRLGPKVRAQVRRPTKAGFEARVTGEEACGAFHALLARRWHELGSPVLPRSWFRELLSQFPEETDFVLVERDGQAVAGAVLMHFGSRVEIPWAASAGEYNRDGVNMLAYWTALERAIERGARWFDFGRSTSDTGTARFKLQWGATETPLVWNVDARTKRGRSNEAGSAGRGLTAALWKRLPTEVVQRLGPHLAARIPL
jgi:FemAB-related protein (PEP-CTERM system-associated)